MDRIHLDIRLTLKINKINKIIGVRKMSSSSSISPPPLLSLLANTKANKTNISLKPATAPNLHPHPTTQPSIITNSQPPLISRREATFSFASLCFASIFSSSSSLADEESNAQCSFVVAPSGLSYCDKVVGSGSKATKGELIKAHYVGRLENGKVFDSSRNRGKPLTFRIGVGEVIKGWDQGILGGDGIPPMFVGGKRILKLPPQLGYGMRGAGCKGGSCIIPPDSTLLFDVEFVGKA